MKKGFTFIEITIVLFIVSAISIGFIQNFRKAQRSHRTNTMIQELMILRNAFFAYYESKGAFTPIEIANLSDRNFANLKPYWYPFNPSASKVVEHKTFWEAETSTTLENIYLQLSSPEDLNLSEGEISSLTRNLCKVELGKEEKVKKVENEEKTETSCTFYIRFYIFKSFDAE